MVAVSGLGAGDWGSADGDGGDSTGAVVVVFVVGDGGEVVAVCGDCVDGGVKSS